ncbi:Ig-like domain-containing protein, partial [Pantoea latae]
TDAAGNETRGESASFTVDSSSVALTIDQANDNVGSITGPVANGGLTDDATPELQGTTSPGAMVTVRDAAGTVLGSSTADAQGIWTFQLAELADGEHSFTAEVTSAAGNRSEASFTLNVDATAPAKPVITSMLDDVGTIQGVATESGGVTDDPAPTFSGTAEKGALVTLYDNGALLGSVKADDVDGSWSYTPTTNLVEGDHSITATATDAAGNVSAISDSWPFELDISTSAPDITTNTEAELAGTAEAGAVIVVTDPTTGSVASTVADADGNWSIQPNPAEVDAKNVEVVATDEAGNSSSIIIDGPADGTPPDNIDSGIIIDSISLIDDVGTITGPIPDGGVTDDARPTYSGQATADIDHVNIYDNGSLIATATVDENGRWSWTPDEDLADGSAHDLAVSAVDAAGNEGPKASGTADDGWSFTVDTSAPDNQSSGIVIDSISLLDDVGPVTGPIPDGGVTDDARPTYSGQATADIDHVNIYDNGSLIATATAAVDVDGRWSWTPESALASGAHALTVSAVDVAGNEGPQVSGTDDAAWDFTLLTSAPAEPSIENVYDDYSQGEDPDTGYLQKNQATNDSTLTLNGSAGQEVTVIIWATDAAGNRVNVGEGRTDANGQWSITTAALGADGVYDLSATAVNAAGVSSTETGPFRIVLDTTPPEAAAAKLTDAQGNVQGTIEEGAITDDRSPLLSGTAEPGATVTIYLDGAAAGSATADASDGSWSLALGPLADGEHSWQVKVTDAAGNETRGESASFTVDSSSVALT